jgi:hypothetical protein
VSLTVVNGKLRANTKIDLFSKYSVFTQLCYMFQPYSHPKAKSLPKCMKVGNTIKGEAPFVSTIYLTGFFFFAILPDDGL